MLFLNANRIGNAGASALAKACASGALPSITDINMGANRATDEGKKAMRDVTGSRGFTVYL